MSVMLLRLLLAFFTSASALDFSISGNGNLVVVGDAGGHEEFTHLTKDTDDSGGSFNSTGRVYYGSPVPFLDVHDSHLAASFNTCFEFQILSSGESNSSGEGLAFIVAPAKAEPPANSWGMYLGLVNASTSGERSNHLFAVEFDTHASQIDLRHEPLVQHIGVDINSIDSEVTAPLPAGFDFLQNSTFHAWIEYTGRGQLLEVRLSNTSERPEAALLSYSRNLVEIVQSRMYVGFSASTGTTDSELHRLIGWNFSSYGIREQAPKCRGFSCTKTIILTSVLAGSAVLIFVAAAASFYILYRKPSLREFESTPLVHFSYFELSNATRGFSKAQLLGRGGFGKVYRADFRGGITLAVKVITEEVSRAKEHEFLAELSTLGEIRHPNLVRLRGWCHSRGRPILVYDYMPNGSLDHHLFWPEVEFLSWHQRYEIITGVAQAIWYLHEERIMHRDIKAANVLLDNDFTPKLGDFGLARLLDSGKALQTMTRVGTSGYIAPELVYAGKATEKSDVYGFGIVCLEVVTARRTLDSGLQLQDMTLLDWLWKMHEGGKLLNCVDERLKEFDRGQVQRVLYMAFLCCDMDGNRRPTMRQCLDTLKETSSLPAPPEVRPTLIFPVAESSSSSNSTGASKFLSSSNSTGASKFLSSSNSTGASKFLSSSNSTGASKFLSSSNSTGASKFLTSSNSAGASKYFSSSSNLD